MREYTTKFQHLLGKLPKYDEFWVINIFIQGLQPQLAKFVGSFSPNTILEAIKLAEEIEFSIWASQKNRLLGNINEMKPKIKNRARGMIGGSRVTRNKILIQMY